MGTDTGLMIDPSPTVLCVSDRRESTARIRDAVASCRSTETIETTTDPTIVPELVAVWSLECVVVDAEMQPVDGFELRSTLSETNPQLPVVVVSTEPALEASPVAVVASERGTQTELVDCLDQIHTDTAAHADSSRQADRRLTRLIEADSRREVARELGTLVAALPSVQNHQIWLVGSDGSLESIAETDGGYPAVPPAISEVVDTTAPQQLSETEVFDPSSANRAEDDKSRSENDESQQTVVYPLGAEGAIAVDFAAHTAALAGSVQRLTTVAAACLDHHAAVDSIETRFRQTAERNRMLSQFARTVAHDLNSPLSVIYGRIELALADQSTAEMHLQAARNATQRVDSLITDHLHSIEAADTENERESVSIQTVAIQAWRIIDPSTARLQIEPQLETVEANAIRLQQLFENLIRNAIEHGSEESIGLGAADSHDPHAVFDDDTDSVTVTIKPTAEGFAVCDNGPGIPPSERETIFESGYTTTETGSGLGLHIVSEIVEAHGWEITVTESASGGARFDVDTR